MRYERITPYDRNKRWSEDTGGEVHVSSEKFIC
jgi:hypothetical protein